MYKNLIILDYAVELQPQLPIENVSSKRGFDFSNTSIVKDQETPFTFGSSAGHTSAHITPISADTTNTNPFIFGDTERSESPKVPRREKSKDSKLHALPKWLKTEEPKSQEKEASRYNSKLKLNKVIILFKNISFSEKYPMNCLEFLLRNW